MVDNLACCGNNFVNSGSISLTQANVTGSTHADYDIKTNGGSPCYRDLIDNLLCAPQTALPRMSWG